MILGACAQQAEVTHQTSVNVDLAGVATLLEAIDGLIDNELDVAGLAAMAHSVSMDEEKLRRLTCCTPSILNIRGSTSVSMTRWSTSTAITLDRRRRKSRARRLIV